MMQQSKDQEPSRKSGRDYQQRNSWLDRNWVILSSVSCFLFSLLEVWKWSQSHTPDATLEAFFNFLVGIAFLFLHRSRKNEERFPKARQQLSESLASRPADVQLKP
jgi:hypothetical protein